MCDSPSPNRGGLLRSLLAAGCLVLAPRLAAQVTFSVTASARSTAQGYTLGLPYTFVFTSVAGFPSTPSSTFLPAGNYWADENAGDAQLWSAVTGGGMTGVYVRPAGNDTSAFLQPIDSPGLSLGAGAENGANIGLSTPLGGAIGTIFFAANGGTLPAFSFSGSYTDPTAYFSSYVGTYTGFSSASDWVRIKDPAGAPYLLFNITSITIGAIPEPSTSAALAGLGALALAVGRRLRRPG